MPHRGVERTPGAVEVPRLSSRRDPPALLLGDELDGQRLGHRLAGLKSPALGVEPRPVHADEHARQRVAFVDAVDASPIGTNRLGQWQLEEVGWAACLRIPGGLSVEFVPTVVMVGGGDDQSVAAERGAEPVVAPLPAHLARDHTVVGMGDELEVVGTPADDHAAAQLSGGSARIHDRVPPSPGASTMSFSSETHAPSIPGRSGSSPRARETSVTTSA